MRIFRDERTSVNRHDFVGELKVILLRREWNSARDYLRYNRHKQVIAPSYEYSNVQKGTSEQS